MRGLKNGPNLLVGGRRHEGGHMMEITGGTIQEGGIMREDTGGRIKDRGYTREDTGRRIWDDGYMGGGDKNGGYRIQERRRRRKTV